MKKLLTTILLAVYMPLNILAYSEFIIPGGENIGITLNSEGLIVVGFYKVNGKYIGSNNLKVGDIILEIENEPIYNINEMSKIIEKNLENNEVNIKINRNGKIINTKLSVLLEKNIYKTGLYIKESVNGIGTLTYIDPVTKIYGALGHEIAVTESNTKVEVRSGNIYESYVKSIDRSANGNVGSKNASINFNTALGTIEKNTKYGIYGKWTDTINNTITLEVGDLREIKTGPAYIKTILNGNEKKEYDIEITRIDKNISSSKAISFVITDEKLLEDAGGIVQGMSGSPIIQNNKIIGAVTHVVVEDVKKGYGIFIRTMLEEGEK